MSESAKSFSFFEVLFVFLRLGLTSFGGPIAHLSYFHDEFVKRLRWVDEAAYADLVALCQFLPGPASSQVGMAIGLSRAGLLGALAAWLGFTLPSAVLLVAFAFGMSRLDQVVGSAWLHGLKLVAVAIVADAVWQMAVKLAPDLRRGLIVLAGAALCLKFPGYAGQMTTIAAGALIGVLFFKQESQVAGGILHARIRRRTGSICLGLFFVLLIALPIAAGITDWSALRLVADFYRAGSLVFGGGHVVLPMLKSAVVDTGMVSASTFMAGYGAAQAVPGPLFSFAAYLGAIWGESPSGLAGAAIALVAIFLPSFFLIAGALPLWEQLRRLHRTRRAMLGVNAAVVGILLAAFYDPVWTSAIRGPRDLAFALGCLALLRFVRLPSYAVVLIGAVGAALLG